MLGNQLRKYLLRLSGGVIAQQLLVATGRRGERRIVFSRIVNLGYGVHFMRFDWQPRPAVRRRTDARRETVQSSCRRGNDGRKGGSDLLAYFQSQQQNSNE